MSYQITIQNTNIPVVEYQGKRVVTFAMIDQVHQRPSGTASRNFKSNKKHFVANEDFYVLDSKSLDEFRPYGIFGESAQKGTLITESGYMMLAKSLTDDLAWSVQRELVNSYFRKPASEKPASSEPPRLTFATKEQREPLVRAVRRLVKVSTEKGKILTYENAHSIINLKMGVESVEQLTVEQIPQAMLLVGELLEKIVLEGEYLAKDEPDPVIESRPRRPVGDAANKAIYTACASVQRYLKTVSTTKMSNNIRVWACKAYRVSSLNELTQTEVNEIVAYLSGLERLASAWHRGVFRFELRLIDAFKQNPGLSEFELPVLN